MFPKQQTRRVRKTTPMTTMTTSNESIQADCPECEAPVVFARLPLSGEIARCSGCGCELEVTSRAPLTLELAPEVEEDWGE